MDTNIVKVRWEMLCWSGSMVSTSDAAIPENNKVILWTIYLFIYLFSKFDSDFWQVFTVLTARESSDDINFNFNDMSKADTFQHWTDFNCDCSLLSF